jgi:hypothetical protein
MTTAMTTMSAALALISAFCLVELPQTVGQQTQQKEPHAEKLSNFQKLAPNLRRETAVPLRLPSFLPYEDEKHPLYATVESATSSQYDILLEFGADCKGAGACLYGSIHGNTSPFTLLDEDERTIVSVKLRGGIKGQFIESVCGAHCDEAYVRWSENSFHYAIGMKAEKMQTLIKVANSAIASSHTAD